MQKYDYYQFLKKNLKQGCSPSFYLKLALFMNLAIDFGNTLIKAGLFEGHNLIENRVYKTVKQLKSDQDFLNRAEAVIIGSVVNTHEDVISVLQHIKTIIPFTSQTPVPLKNLYKSASTLGSDRLAASVGAFSIYPFRDILVIDAGTCLKYNFTNRNNEYLGGAISPGLQMRFKALQYFTDKLPLVNAKTDYNKLIGNTTEESILSGVINGIIHETDGIINEYKNIYPDLTIVVSGGDTDFFAKRLKNRIFAHPYLILNGLNEILIFNS